MTQPARHRVTTSGVEPKTSSQLEPLPEGGVLVHIGPHKTGTTSIQSTLASCRSTLLQHGVFYPGSRTAHHTAAKALRGYRTGWSHDSDPAPGPETWSRLVNRANRKSGRVVISSEFLAEADAAGRAQVVHDLGPDRVHLVVGARNCASIAVSNWQQVLRSGYPVTLDQWLERQFRRDSVDDSRAFWDRADPAALVATWLDVLPPERITVVVVDDRDRTLLPRTFERLLDLPPGLLTDQPAPQSNRGLSAVEAALAHKIIAALQSHLTWSEYSQLMRNGVIRRLLEVRTPGPEEPKSALPDWAAEQAVREGEHSAEALVKTGVRIVGDVDWLRVSPRPGSAPLEITDVPLELAAEAVVGAIASATRMTWTFDVPAPTATSEQATAPDDVEGIGPAAAPGSGGTEAVVKVPGSDENSAPTVASIPTRDLARLIGKRVRAGVMRRYRRLRRRLA